MSDGLRLMLASCCDDVCSAAGCLCAERIDAVISAARREGAEAMRERCAVAAETHGIIVSNDTSSKACARNIEAALRSLPLEPEPEGDASIKAILSMTDEYDV